MSFDDFFNFLDKYKYHILLILILLLLWKVFTQNFFLVIIIAVIVYFVYSEYQKRGQVEINYNN